MVKTDGVYIHRRQAKRALMCYRGDHISICMMSERDSACSYMSPTFTHLIVIWEVFASLTALLSPVYICPISMAPSRPTTSIRRSLRSGMENGEYWTCNSKRLHGCQLLSLRTSNISVFSSPSHSIYWSKPASSLITYGGSGCSQ